MTTFKIEVLKFKTADRARDTTRDLSPDTSYVVEDQQLRIGRDPACEVRLREAEAALEHCRVWVEGGQLLVQDLGSATGTYLGGKAIAGPVVLTLPARLLVGSSAITLESAADGAPGTYRVKVAPRTALSTPGLTAQGAWQPGEREIGRQQEVAFSRFPLLWLCTWTALPVAVALVCLTLHRGLREEMVDPGPLHSTHAALFTGGALPAGLRDEVVMAAARGCQACHEGGTVPMERCLDCHGDLKTAHPFAPGNSEHWRGDACTLCHMEHRGTAPVAATELMRAEQANLASGSVVRSPFIPGVEETQGSCDSLGCHAGNPITAASKPLERAVAYLRDHPPELDRGAAHSRIQRYPSFSHRDHAKIRGQGEDCLTCHKQQTGSVPDADPHRDFVEIDFQACMACHEGDGSDRWTASLTVDPRFRAQAPDFLVKWHGAADEKRCLACHQTLWKPELRQVSRAVDVGRLYQATPREHDPYVKQAQTPATPDACTMCHRDGDPGRLRDTLVVQPFRHDLHCRSPVRASWWPFTYTFTMPLDAGAVCLPCHATVAAAKTMDGSLLPDMAGCAVECHNPPLRVTSEGQESDPLVDFPHQLHLEANRLCSDCHSFAENGLAQTRTEASDCSGCHGTSAQDPHRQVAGDACIHCHKAGDANLNTPHDDPTWPHRRATQPAFRHFSSGHRGDTMRADGCKKCHENVWEATRLEAVRILAEDGPEKDNACRDCHLKDKNRFHWR